MWQLWLGLFTVWNLNHKSFASRMDLICKCFQRACNRIMFNDLGGLLGRARFVFVYKICHQAFFHSSLLSGRKCMSSRINIIIPFGLSLLLRITGKESVWWGTETVTMLLLSCSAAVQHSFSVLGAWHFRLQCSTREFWFHFLEDFGKIRRQVTYLCHVLAGCFLFCFLFFFFPLGSAKWKTTAEAALGNLLSRLGDVQEQQAVMIQHHNDFVRMQIQVFVHIMLWFITVFITCLSVLNLALCLQILDMD